jgi:acetyl-CoA carboxylase biotin carboxyl carrier protein
MSEMESNVRTRADQLAELMDEFRLEEARLEGEDWKVAFRKTKRAPKVVSGYASGHPEPGHQEEAHEESLAPAAPSAPTGMPISSPMTGIYYASPNPTSPPFVTEGEMVNMGQVVGLIEAMKVFNEIIAPVSGIVSKVVAKNGEVVNPGEPLLYIG